MDERFYSAEEAAQLLGLQVRTVRTHIRSGRIRAVKLGKQYRIGAGELQRLSGGIADDAGKPPATATADGVAASAEPTVADVVCVVDVRGLERVSAARMARTVKTAIGADGGSPAGEGIDAGSGVVAAIFDEQRSQLRLTVSGTTAQVATVLRLVDALVTNRG